MGLQLQIQLLGRVDLAFDGTPIPRPGAKDLALLVYLAVSGPADRPDLAGLLWGEGRLRNLRQALYSLAKLPGADGWLIRGDPSSIDATTDLAELRNAVSDRRWIEAARLANEGPFAEGLRVTGDLPFHEWLGEERNRIDRLRQEAFRGAAQEWLDQGRLDDALGSARAAVGLDAWDEGALAVMVRALARLDRRGEAGDELSAHIARLEQDLGLRPSDVLLELRRELRGPAVPTPGQGLVGRDNAMQAVSAGIEVGRLALVTGPEGIGKSALVAEWLQSRRAHLLLRAEPGDSRRAGLALRRFIEVIVERGVTIAGWARDELARVAPGAFPEGRPPSDSPPSRFAAALDEAVGGASASFDAFVVDGLDRIDADGQNLLLRALLPIAQRRAVVMALREEQLADAAREVLEGAEANGWIERVRLDPLHVRSFRQLFKARGVDLSRARAQALHAHTGGNPGLAVEMLQYAEREDLDVAEEDLASLVPERARAAFDRRFATLAANARRVVELLALSEEPLEADVIAGALGIGVLEVLDALEEGERAGFLSDGWFESELARESVSGGMSPQRRRLLSGRLADSLAAEGAEPSVVAEGYLAAGRPEDAAPFLLRSASQAAAAGALARADEGFRQVAELSEGTTLEVEAWLGVSDLYRREGRSEDESLDRAARAARLLQDDRSLFDVAIRLADHAVRCGNAEAGDAPTRDALDIADRLGDSELRAQAYAGRGVVLIRSGRLAESVAHFEEAVGASDEQTRVTGMWGLGVFDGMQGRLESAYQRHREALTIARRIGDLLQAKRLLGGLAATAERMAWYDESLRRFEESLELSRHQMDLHDEVGIYLNMSEVTRKRGLFAKVLEQLGRAKALIQHIDSARLRLLLVVRQSAFEFEVGRFSEAIDGWKRAVALATDAGDPRIERVARFNLRLAELQKGGASKAALDAAADIEALGERQIARWAYLELALYARDATAAGRALGRVPAQDDSKHVTLVRRLAEARLDPTLELSADDWAEVVEYPLVLRLLAEVDSDSVRAEASEAALKEQLAGLPVEYQEARRAMVRDFRPLS